MKTRLEDSVERIHADWHRPRPAKDGRICRCCKHCGTAREAGVVCKHPFSVFRSTEIDAVCKRFEQRVKP